MQTLRKKTSPCKYKNEPARFLGDGVSFKAKLIGILEVSEARGDRMCQDALADLKMAIRAAGEHKQRININIAIDGLRLRDEKTGDCLYHHPVHKISFIAQDMSDSRAFGYIFGSPDTGHRFFGIKTDKAASQVVITMRDLFQVVFELKKKEIELAKQHIEHQIKYNSPLISELINKGSIDPVKNRPMVEDSKKKTSTGTGDTEEHNIMDLLDLELELNNIQQGINQMDRITPSDPFGPGRAQGGVSVGANAGGSGGAGLVTPAVSDPFGDSFTVSLAGVSSTSNVTKLPPPPESGRKARQPEVTKQWMDNEPLFDQNDLPQTFPLVTIPAESNSVSESSLKKENEATRDQFDVFTDLDPLGTGRSKPYVDKKDFFQDLKNPPKKVLKDLVIEVSTTETKLFANDDEKSSVSEIVTTHPSQNLYQSTCMFENDPFKEDPFDKDPFCEVDFSKTTSVFTPVSNSTDLFEKFECFQKFADFDTSFVADSDKEEKPAPLRVSLPPEKLGSLEGSPLSRRKLQRGQTVLRPPSPKQKTRKTYSEDRIDFPDNSSTIRLRPAYSTAHDSYIASDTTAPDPPPRSSILSGSALKPPPLPPKKVTVMGTTIVRGLPRQSQPDYDYIENYESRSGTQDSLGCMSSMTSPPLPAPARKPKKPDCEYYLQPFPLLPPPKKKLSKDKTISLPEEESNIPHSHPQQQPQLTESVTPNKSLDITLSQLTKTGFSELAASLNMSPTSLSKMTLQELTKCLASISSLDSVDQAAVSLNDETKVQSDRSVNFSSSSNIIPNVEEEEGFKAEFDAHFSSSAGGIESAHQLSDESLFDKYAVFRELLEEEKRLTNEQEMHAFDTSNHEKTKTTEVEDRYAALRDICLDEVTEEKYEELSDKDDSPGDRSRTEEDTDLLPSRPHSQSTDSPTVTIKEHQMGGAEGTILEEDSVCETGKEEVGDGVFSVDGEDNGGSSSGVGAVGPLCDTTSTSNPLPLLAGDTSWAKFDCQTETRASSSIHSDGHVSPWSTESKDNDLSPCNNKKRHRKVRNRSGDWDDEESEEWDWRENGWSDADSLYGESGPYGNEYWVDERGGSAVPVRVRHRSSPWDSRDASPWEEDGGEWGWHGHGPPPHSRQGPPLRPQPSWHRPLPLPPPRNHSSSRESLTCDEHHSYQIRSYRRAKWDDERHRWRDWENKARYYKEHRDWEAEHSDHDRWSRPRSCDRARRHDDHDRRYSRPRDGHYSDIDRRKAQTMQSQKSRRKPNQTSPFEDDFSAQFTFSKDSESKLLRYDGHKKYSQYSDYREEKRSYQHSPFEDDFTLDRKVSGVGGCAGSGGDSGSVGTSGCRSSGGEADCREDRRLERESAIAEVTYVRSRQASGPSSHPGDHDSMSGPRRHRQVEHEHQVLNSQTSLRKSESVNIFARNNDPFDDEFFCENNPSGGELGFNIPSESKWAESFAAFNFDQGHK